MSDDDAVIEPFNVLTRARHGQALYNRHDLYIGRALELYGEWCEGEIDLLRQVLRPGMVAVDVGANIGTHTVPMARAVTPGGVVYGFEPQRIVFQTLAANVALNSLTNVICQQRALGDVPGIARVPALDYATANNFGGVELRLVTATDEPEQASAGEPVEVVRLDDFELVACHLIKIDVEGMELAVLRGAAATIARCQPVLYVEADRAANHDDLIGWLDEHGYAMYWHPIPLYNPDNFKANPTNVFEGIISLNLLAIPASVPQEVAGLERVAVPGRPAEPILTRQPPILRRPGGHAPPGLARPVARRARAASSAPIPRPREGPTPQPLRGANIGCADVPPHCDGQ